MPTPLVSLAGAAVVALGGVGVGSLMLNAGGTSSAPASTVPSLAANPTGRPSHSRYVYSAPPAQHSLPALPPLQGQAPDAGPPPAGGAPYDPHGQPAPPLGRVPQPQPTPQPTTWKLYLSGGDLLQPDPGVAVQTDQSVGPSVGGACEPGLAGRWQSPPPGPVSLHGPIPGLLHVQASGTAQLTISWIVSTYGGSCSVLGSTTATATGDQAVPFTLPRVDANLPVGVNIGLVVAAAPSATITSTSAAPSYVIAPMSPQ